MDKKKMIKEISTCFCGYHDAENDKCKFYLHRPLCDESDCLYPLKVADIVNKYIPEGAVVLTKKEYNQLRNDLISAVNEINCLLSLQTNEVK